MVKPRKLEMKMRKTAKERSISFTKRRQGLFSKAANFSLITDAHIALWVASPCPNGKTYSFTTHHSIHEILGAFLQHRPPQPVHHATKGHAMSLWHDINTLETNNPFSRNQSSESATQGSLEEFENCDSVEVLKDIVNRLESMKNGLISRMKNKAISQALPSHSYSGSNILEVSSVQPISPLNHHCCAAIVGGESSDSGMDILLPCGFTQEDNVRSWSNDNPNFAFDQTQNQDFFYDQVTELMTEDAVVKQFLAEFDCGVGCVKNDSMDNELNEAEDGGKIMDNKLNEVEDGGRVMGSTWNPNVWNWENDESVCKKADGGFMPAVPFEFEEKPIRDEWFCLPPLE